MLDPARDRLWMCEHGVATGFVPGGPPGHKRRIAFALSAMRHFAAHMREQGFTVDYRAIDEEPSFEDPAEALEADLATLRPTRVAVTRPGDHAFGERLAAATRRYGAELEFVEDAQFFTTPADFAAFMEGRKTPLLESFYRRVRRRESILLDEEGNPQGGAWNFDRENRESFPRTGPVDVPPQPQFHVDDITDGVTALVERRYASHPGADAQVELPVTPADARAALADFTEHRLPHFGAVQDAMWTAEPFLYHSRLSAPLNMGLLDPREVVEAAERAWRDGGAPINAVEGFIRQVAGWREYVRGVYFHYMPAYATRNALGAAHALPPLYWTGETQMRCLADVMSGILTHAYAHHIQRLMVAGLFALLYGARPDDFNGWHVAMYIDAFDWVSVPNTIGMSLHADGGTVGTKPYAATGKYISRMSNYCRNCPFDPADASGKSACPFTTLYWTFLERHRDRFRGNRRMTFQLKNLERKDDTEMQRIRARETDVRHRAATGTL